MWYKPEARVEKGSVVGIKGEKALNPCICLPVLLSIRKLLQLNKLDSVALQASMSTKMSTPKRASARWRRKKLDEDPQEFRAKEALQIRNYRARMKEKQLTQDCTGQEVFTLQDANTLPDDVDTWLNSVSLSPSLASSINLPHFTCLVINQQFWGFAQQ
ncbi:hypothetical protein DFH94DRAFT_685326 [Russula ochroleuca]|uniref:Uncharacterized protein n=1 Tax=Russula ochroleuca TaxID=152965 RepID=A0A9P5JYE0_9AGAM|nr:hypothetical protein DFH94DRAFT_685326 [Russula ochroleuca]